MENEEFWRLYRQEQILGHYAASNTGGTVWDNNNIVQPWGRALATCSVLIPTILAPIPQAAGKTRRNLMKVYEVVTIDSKKNTILRSTHIAAKDKEAALVSLNLDGVEIALREQERLAVICVEIGSYERYVSKVEVVDPER